MPAKRLVDFTFFMILVHRNFWGPMLVFCGSLFVLLWGSEMLPLTWDEGESADRAEKIVGWFSEEHRWTAESIRTHWIFTTQREGHPAGYGIVIAVGKTVARELFAVFPCGLSPRTELRFGPIFLVALALGAVFGRISVVRNRRAALFVVWAVLSIPRLFADFQIAACDSVLTAAWLLSWASFEVAFSGKSRTKTERIAGTVFWSLCFGLTLSSKFTGWAAVVPFLLAHRFFTPHSSWGSIAGENCAEKNSERIKDRDFSGFFRTQLGRWLRSCSIFLGPLVVFFVLNPPLWFEPVSGFARFFSLNTTREGFNISILFFGKMYNLDHPLPWYNTILWTLITVPTSLLFLFAAGLFDVFAKRNREGHFWDRSDFGFVVVLLLHFATLLFIRAFPGTPPHDGVRLFVSSFAFLGIVAGLGADAIWTIGSRIGIRKTVPWGPLLVVLLFGNGFFNLAWYAPQWLSYYNALIGGLDGATRRGMEPTYYWDSCDREVLDWINTHTTEGELVRFSASSGKSLALLRQWKELKPDFYRKSSGPTADRKVRWYILQRRPSGEYPIDRSMIRNKKPVYTKTIRKGGVGIWRFERTPLLEIYNDQDYREIRARLKVGKS